MVLSELSCCKQLCAEHYPEDGNARRILQAERDKLFSYSAASDRKRFVSDRVPVCDLKHGAMMAGGLPVCADFFCKVFRTSRNLVYAAKGTPGARASSECDGR